MSGSSVDVGIEVHKSDALCTVGELVYQRFDLIHFRQFTLEFRGDGAAFCSELLQSKLVEVSGQYVRAVGGLFVKRCGKNII